MPELSRIFERRPPLGGRVMSDFHEIPLQSRKGKEGQYGFFWLFILALGLVGAAVALSVMRREEAEPFVLALLAFFSIIGVISLFAATVGFLRFGERNPDSEVAARVSGMLTDGLVVTAPDQRVIYANKAYAIMSSADTRGAPSTVPRAFAAYPEANDPMYRLAQAAREGRRWQEEFRVVVSMEDNLVSWYRVCVQPFDVDASGRRVAGTRMLWRVADTTCAHQSQENMFEEMQQAIDYLDNAPGGFFSVNNEGMINYMNATLACWLGMDLTQTVSLPVSEIVVGDSGALLARATPTPGDMCTEILDIDLRRCDGTFLPVRLLHDVSFSADGNPDYSRTLVINRSQGEDVAEDLRAAEVRFARFFNNAPIAIATVDNDGRIVRANSGFARMQEQCAPRCGLRPPFLKLLAGESHQAVNEALHAAEAGKCDIPPVDVILAGDDGLSARLFVSPVRDAETAGEAALVYVIDTTAQRALEMQFAQSQKMQAVGQLAGGVAHDFNNMLTAIIGYSDLLLAAHRPQDPAFKDIMNIKQSANKAAGLVGQLLAFSRRQILQPEVLQLAGVISDLRVMLGRLLGEKVLLEASHDRDLWLVKADRVQLEQVMINLAVNARDAMPDGGRIGVRIVNMPAQDIAALNYSAMPVADYVMVEVSDTGCGIGQDVMDKIFEPFFSTKEVGKGTGLGLSTVYGVVKQTGGFIYPFSEVGKGTTFRIFLPRHIVVDEAEAPQKTDTKPATTDLTGRGVILLVEDEDAVRSFATRALTSRGYTVLEASTGVMALEVLDAYEGEVDLVVSDVVMPEMDGPTLLKKLRQKIPDVKVVFMSGYAEEAFRKNLDTDARFVFLQKPFNLKSLAATVKQTLEEK